MHPKPLVEFRAVAHHELGTKFTPLEVLDVLPFAGRKVQERREEPNRPVGEHLPRDTLGGAQEGGQFAIQDFLRESIQVAHAVRREGSGQDATERDEQASQQGGVMGRWRGREPCHIVEIPCCHPIEEGQQLPGHHFFQSGQPSPAGRVWIRAPSVAESRGTEGHPEHEVYVDLYSTLGSKAAPIRKVKFPPGMFLGGPLNPVFLSACDLFQRSLEMPSLFEHLTAVNRPNVVEIEIRRQPGNATEKEIERRSALQRQPVSQKWVPRYLIQKPPEA